MPKAPTFKFLVIDDEEDANQLTCELLHEQGYQTVSAFSFSEAKDLLEKNDDVDVAIVDMRMEEDQVGLTIIKFLQANYPLIVAVVLTGYANYEEVALCMNAGATGYIVKGMSTKLHIETFKEACFKRVSLTVFQLVWENLFRVMEEVKGIRHELKGIDQNLSVRETALDTIRDQIGGLLGKKDK